MVHILTNLFKILSEDINVISESLEIDFKKYCLIVKPDRIYNDLYILNLKHMGFTITNKSFQCYFYNTERNRSLPKGMLWLQKENYNKYHTDIGWCILNKKYIKLLNLKIQEKYDNILSDIILVKRGSLEVYK